MNVTVNFGSVFATIKDESVLKEVANSISMQLKDAYTKRVQELAKKSVKPALKVDIKTGTTEKAEKKVEKAKPAPKKEAKTESKKAEKKGAPKKEAAEKEPQIALTDVKAMKKLGLKFIPYSEKCVLLTGNTKPIAKELGKLKKSGVFGNGHLKAVEGFDGGFGWLVNKNNSEYKNVCKALHLKAI